VTASEPSAASDDAAPRQLCAGPLSLLFDDGGLRYIRLGEKELVRRIYCAVRDADWGTVPHRLHNLRALADGDSFRVEFDAHHQEAEIDFSWRGTITGEADGRLTFEMNGVANTAFRKNRIGFCVLHPPDLAGAPVRICHADGTAVETNFPRWIAPYNPFLDVVGMRHAAAPGVEIELSLEGDVFETEDQRNWLDASFKTFCTPLSRPFPAEVRAGERFFQRVTIRLHGGPKQPATRPAATSAEIRLELANESVGLLPQLGFDLPEASPALNEVAIQRLRLLKPAHLRSELRLWGSYAAALKHSAQLAEQLSAKLDLAVYYSAVPQRQLAELIELVRQLRPPIARWTIFPEIGWATMLPLAELVARALRDYDSQIPVGGGTPANFLELNRNRPPAQCLDFITWSQNPQVHATDEASIVETLAAHGALVESARQFTSGLPLVVGPITLKPRVNPYAAGSWLPGEPDHRQRSLLAAGWTLGSIKYLAEGGALAATYYQLHGPQGIVEPDGNVLPLYHVLADLAELPQAPVRPVRSSAPLLAEGLALEAKGNVRLLVANLSSQLQRVALCTPAKSARIRILDNQNLSEATADPAAFRAREEARPLTDGGLALTLPAHAVARVDLCSVTHD
jgi:hypothetical protein